MTDTNGKPELIFNRSAWTCAVCGEFVPGNVENHVHNSTETIAKLRHTNTVLTGACDMWADKYDALQAQLRKENSQLTDALYKEAKRTVEAHALIQRVLYAKGTDTLDRLDIKPFLEWVEAFPKPPAICEHGNKPDTCAHCHPRWD